MGSQVVVAGCAKLCSTVGCRCAVAKSRKVVPAVSRETQLGKRGLMTFAVALRDVVGTVRVNSQNRELLQKNLFLDTHKSHNQTLNKRSSRTQRLSSLHSIHPRHTANIRKPTNEIS